MDSGRFGKFNKLLDEHNATSSWVFFQKLLVDYDFIFDELLSERCYQTESDEYSRYFDIAESLEYSREFLYCLSNSLGERFDVLSRSFINGKPIYTFKPVADSYDKENGFTNGFINIAYENTARDGLTIVHETFHLFNYGLMDVDGKKIINLTSRLFTELVSILAEKLYIAYAFNKKYIDTNEVALLFNDRIDNTYLSIYITKCEQLYLELNKKGIYIDPYIIKQIKKEFKGVPYYDDFWKRECKTKDVVTNAVTRGTLTYPINLGYLLGEFYSNLILEHDKNPKELLVELNEIITDPYVRYDDVMEKCLEKRLKH